MEKTNERAEIKSIAEYAQKVGQSIITNVKRGVAESGLEIQLQLKRKEDEIAFLEGILNKIEKTAIYGKTTIYGKAVCNILGRLYENEWHRIEKGAFSSYFTPELESFYRGVIMTDVARDLKELSTPRLHLVGGTVKWGSPPTMASVLGNPLYPQYLSAMTDDLDYPNPRVLSETAKTNAAKLVSALEEAELYFDEALKCYIHACNEKGRGRLYENKHYVWSQRDSYMRLLDMATRGDSNLKDMPLKGIINRVKEKVKQELGMKHLKWHYWSYPG